MGKRSKVILATFSFILIIFIIPFALASEVTVKIRAVNPFEKNYETTVKEYLPKGVTPEAITGKGNFKIIQDKEKGLYYAEQKVSMKPKEVLVFQIRVKDIWVVPKQKIETLRKEAAKVYAAKPADPAASQTAQKLYEQIGKTLDRVEARQAQNTIAKIGAEPHMDEYWKDIDSIKQTESDIKLLKAVLSKKEQSRSEKK
jgi:hypothetical protein